MKAVTDNEIVHSSLRNKSIFNHPVNNNKYVDVFEQVVLEDLKTLKIKKREEPNFVKSGIRKLTKRKDIVIRSADEGGGIVILSKKTI